MPADDELRELLGHIPFFAGLWDRGLEWVARTLVERAVPQGADVFRVESGDDNRGSVHGIEVYHKVTVVRIPEKPGGRKANWAPVTESFIARAGGAKLVTGCNAFYHENQMTWNTDRRSSPLIEFEHFLLIH